MTKNAKQALELIRGAKEVVGIDAKESYNLDIDFINDDIVDDDDIAVAGKYATIFVDDLNDCAIENKTIYVKGQYILHIKNNNH
jgi:hypothetical protein